jgi:four helix bundle protein
LEFPKIEQYALGDQIRRASKSICANVAEGFGKQGISKAEFKRFLQMALGSANEMLVWIKYCAELNYIHANDAAQWQDEYRSICRMLNALHGRS